MKSYLAHLQINIDFANVGFYKDLMTFLGWSIIFEDQGIAGFTSGKDASIWFLKSKVDTQMNYDHVGMNHIGIQVETRKDVDAVVEFLRGKEIDALFGTPKHRPEFAIGDDKTYYQVMFETPDKVLVEIVYIGQK